MTHLEMKSNIIANTCFEAFTKWASSDTYRELHKEIFGTYPQNDPLNGHRTIEQIMQKIRLHHIPKHSQTNYWQLTDQKHSADGTVTRHYARNS